MADQLCGLIGRHTVALQRGEGRETDDRSLLLPTLLQQLFTLAGRLTVLLVVVIEAGQTQAQGIVSLDGQCGLVAGDGAGPVGLLGLDIPSQTQQLKSLLLWPLFIGKSLLHIATRLCGLLQVGGQRGL